MSAASSPPPTTSRASPEVRRAWRLFMALAVVKAVAVLALGRDFLYSPQLDANVYLEVAHNLLQRGWYGSLVHRPYPPGYPLFALPAVALGRPDLLFPALYLLASAATSAACALLPGWLQGPLGGRARAVRFAAFVQLAPALFLHHLVPQSEVLYAAIGIAGVAALAAAVARDRGGAWIAFGATLGLGLATRRFGVVPVAAALLLGVAWALGSWRAGFPGGLKGLRRLALVAGGFALGALPEVGVLAAQGTFVQPYSHGAAERHASALLRALSTGEGILHGAVPTLARQSAYLVLLTAGAPAVLAASLALAAARRRDPTRAMPAPLLATSAFVLLVTLGGVALTSAHILHHFGHPVMYHLYPRYLDPVEVPLLAAAAAASAWALGPGEGSPRRLALWIAGAGLLAPLVGEVTRIKGARVVYLVDWLVDRGVPSGPWALAALTVWTVAVGAGAAARGRWRGSAALGVVLPLAWLLALAGVGREFDLSRQRVRATPRILRVPPVAERPLAPLAVLVDRKASRGRAYYSLFWKVPNPLWILSPGEEAAFFARHPDGFLIASAAQRVPARRLRRAASWVAYGAPGQETEPPAASVEAEETREEAPDETE